MTAIFVGGIVFAWMSAALDDDEPRNFFLPLVFSVALCAALFRGDLWARGVTAFLCITRVTILGKSLILGDYDWNTDLFAGYFLSVLGHATALGLLLFSKSIHQYFRERRVITSRHPFSSRPFIF